jgi:hypothetical protein
MSKLKIRKIELDSEAADRITMLNLKDYRSILRQELKDYKKGSWLHSEDVVGNQTRIKALDLIIKDFGG